jgi:hypothetical protein
MHACVARHTHTLATPVRLARMDTERVVVDALRNEMTILLEIAVAEPLPADNNRCGCPSTCHDRSVGLLLTEEKRII